MGGGGVRRRKMERGCCLSLIELLSWLLISKVAAEQRGRGHWQQGGREGGPGLGWGVYGRASFDKHEPVGVCGMVEQKGVLLM